MYVFYKGFDLYGGVWCQFQLIIATVRSLIISICVKQVTVSVVRIDGTDEQVFVTYTTTAGSAQSYADFYPSANTLTFQQGQTIQTIEIRIIQDDLPEGPEDFFVNLTSARLVNPR